VPGKINFKRNSATRYGLTVTVAHYPAGASKYNPIERRLFSQISRNWAGEPLVSYDKILRYIRTTKTSTGLSVTARLDRRDYPVGVKPSASRLRQLNVTEPHSRLDGLHDPTLECEIVPARPLKPSVRLLPTRRRG